MKAQCGDILLKFGGQQTQIRVGTLQKVKDMTSRTKKDDVERQNT